MDTGKIVKLMPATMKANYITCLSGILDDCDSISTLEELKEGIQEMIDTLTEAMPKDDINLLRACMKIVRLGR